MVDIMETAPDIARALFKGDQSAFWKELADNLNPLGPPIKNVATWKRVWFDYKCAVKKKLRDNKASLTATGGGPNRTKLLNELEERVANLTNLRATVEGNSAARFGISRPGNNSIENNPNTDIVPTQNQISSQQQQEPEVLQKQQNGIITGPIGNRSNRKRKNTDAVLQQNKAMLEMMAKLIKLQEETNLAMVECTKQIRILSNVLTKQNNNLNSN
ncbi:uncharacterized protein LOC125769399 [Anopheles funestus]|uniref:uncharacterized protein LOC125769399 n=1 Tax=Anopheles funestus TaxID=62324 RepID=UPI0020C64012|nr:uncharacterized protein LOC125769399 [Anopheles funestus]